MTSPFRSTLGVAARRRQRPVVERSTFVIVGVDRLRLAFPVEQVERVLRSAHTGESIRFAERDLRVQSLAALFTRNVADVRMLPHDKVDVSVEHRVLVIHTPHHTDALSALRVDTVSEVFAIESASVRPVITHDEVPFNHPAIRGCFDRHDTVVWVIDTARLVGAADA